MTQQQQKQKPRNPNATRPSKTVYALFGRAAPVPSAGGAHAQCVALLPVNKPECLQAAAKQQGRKLQQLQAVC